MTIGTILKLEKYQHFDRRAVDGFLRIDLGLQSTSYKRTIKAAEMSAFRRVRCMALVAPVGLGHSATWLLTSPHSHTHTQAHRHSETARYNLLPASCDIKVRKW